MHENRFHIHLTVPAALFRYGGHPPYVEEICRAHIHRRPCVYAHGLGLDQVAVMHKVNTHQMRDTEPSTATPCRQADDPERWFPEGQLPDPTAVADCWSCFFQPQCAMRALTLQPKPEHGVWGGYRLAPGPGLSRSRKQLRIIAGLDIGPAASPGVEVSEELLRRAELLLQSPVEDQPVVDTDTEVVESRQIDDPAQLSPMTDVELRGATATALVDASFSGDNHRVDACETEARRRGKPCMSGHAHAEVAWGPDVADLIQSRCCITDGDTGGASEIGAGAEVIPLPAPKPSRQIPAMLQPAPAMAHAWTG